MKFIIFALFFLCILNPCYAFNFQFRKKQPLQKVKMVETKQEWEQSAQNVPLKDRKIEHTQEPQSDKKNYYPQAHYVFERYNYPAGKRSYDIRFIKKNLVEHPIIVADSKCHYVAYANYYYRPDIDQIYSDFYVEKLDTTKTKTQRILDYEHKQLKRMPVLVSGFKEQYKNLFNGLSLVDWSADNNKVLIKEEIGSTLGGIYQTMLYVYFVDRDETIRLSNFNYYLADYFQNYENIAINHHKYTIEPLGFSAQDDNLILVYLYMYDKTGAKIFSGVWGYNLDNNKIILISKTNPVVSVSSNGLALKRVLE